MKLTTFAIAVLALAFTLQAKATVMAVIDSGTDFSHPDLVNVKWTNPNDVEDGVDNDSNGFIDDINGWNFADNNNQLYDKSFLGTFSQDTYDFFAVQTRLLRGTGTPADLAWIKTKQTDDAFIANLEVFANFVHGSHVAGIMTKNSPNSQLMALKIMPTKSPVAAAPATTTTPATPPAACGTIAAVTDTMLRAGLKALAGQQGKAMLPFGQYVNAQKARVANCSFGISTTAAQGTLAPLLTSILKCTPTAEQLQSYAATMVTAVVASQAVLVTSAPNTLFVIAAGNDGTDNDALPASPANIKMDNTITVAATMDYTKLASFSNYGNTMVEVAAPGVGIESSIPGDMHLTVSGTSQASPFVANIAGQILDQNPALALTDVKKIIMGTVDLKPWLQGKVVSQGVANPSRAILAAKMSLTQSVDDAINSARMSVMDMPKRKANKNGFAADYEGYVMPLPTLFN
jgi:cell wall-associated protease